MFASTHDNIDTFIVDGGDGPISFLSCTIPELIPHSKTFNGLVNEGEVVAHSGWDVFAEDLIGEEADEGGFTNPAATDKTHLHKLVNVAVVLLRQLQQ